jgi:hypothetical protein
VRARGSLRKERWPRRSAAATMLSISSFMDIPPRGNQPLPLALHLTHHLS